MIEAGAAVGSATVLLMLSADHPDAGLDCTAQVRLKTTGHTTGEWNWKYLLKR